ncbi:MAG: NAD(P)/FAD-dependent oxidoreductase [Vicinamibacterales bacterium]
MTATADVVVIGGGVVGSAAAWQLRGDGVTGRVVVVERDPTYARASSFLAMGGIRQQFGSAVCVQMVQHSVRLWREFDERMRTPAHTPRAWFRPRGYLFLADDATSAALAARAETQAAAGAVQRRLAVDEIAALVPGLMLDDIRWGLFGPDDGYANPREVLFGLRAAADAAGAEFVRDAVVGLDLAGGRVTGVRLASGASLSAPVVVNAAGALAGRVAALAGLRVPIEPVRQLLFRCTLPRHWPTRFPMVIDPGGVHWRHDDPVAPGDPDRITLAFTKWDEPPGENFACDDARWEHEFYPALVRRMPALADVADVHGWAGLYEMTPDHNPVLGEHPEVGGLIFASGFSGHGLMMSPATGLVVSELVRLGHSRTFDITPFAVDRFARGELVRDGATI